MAKKRSEPNIRRVGVSEFKVHGLAILRDLQRDGGMVVLTRRGHEIARVLPAGRLTGSSRGMCRGLFKPAGRDIAGISFASLWKPR